MSSRTVTFTNAKPSSHIEKSEHHKNDSTLNIDPTTQSLAQTNTRQAVKSFVQNNSPAVQSNKLDRLMKMLQETNEPKQPPLNRQQEPSEFRNTFHINTIKGYNPYSADYSETTYMMQTLMDTLHKRLPDLLIPGGVLKSSHYQNLNTTERNEGDAAASDDDFIRLKNQTPRYFQTNPTMKCHRCHEFGHIQRECPNERQKQNCDFCGDETHVSYQCTQQMCFKCNQRGHKAYECKAKNLQKCENCYEIGHHKSRCLKIWKQGIFNKSELKCIECGDVGHLKCHQNTQSQIKITYGYVNPFASLVTEKRSTTLVSRKIKDTNIMTSDRALSRDQNCQNDDSYTFNDFQLTCSWCGFRNHDVEKCNQLNAQINQNHQVKVVSQAKSQQIQTKIKRGKSLNHASFKEQQNRSNHRFFQENYSSNSSLEDYGFQKQRLHKKQKNRRKNRT